MDTEKVKNSVEEMQSIYQKLVSLSDINRAYINGAIDALSNSTVDKGKEAG